MTQEQKDLLLKDLCGRLPHGVKLQKTYDTSEPVELYSIDLEHSIVKFYKYKGEALTICDAGFIERYGKLRFKPYLFPLSSMSEEQLVIYGDLCYAIIHSLAWDMQAALNELVDWLNKNHFDYRGLIPMDLGIDATGLNIY